MENPILNKIIEERKGHYSHCLEVELTCDLESIVEAIIEGYPDYKENEYIEFFQNMEVYYLGDDPKEEREVFDFNFQTFIEGTI